MDYFIICHDQGIIDHPSYKNIYSLLPNYQILFVGNGANNKIKQYNSKITICKNLNVNIEEYPLLCSFTGWYAIAKNSLNSSNKICLLEYDIDITNKFHSSNQAYINTSNTVVAYNKTLLHHYVFYKSTPWLEIALKQVYNIKLIELLNNELKNIYYWPTSTNYLLDLTILKSFVDWFIPMAEIFQHHPLGSYVHERAFFIYCVLNGIEIKYNLNCCEHKQLASHNNHDLYGSFLQRHNTRDFKEYMREEYDRLYEDTLKSLL